MERFETIIDGIKYTFAVFGRGKLWSANAYINGNCVALADSEKGSDDVILKLVKLLEK